MLQHSRDRCLAIEETVGRSPLPADATFRTGATSRVRPELEAALTYADIGAGYGLS